MINYKKIRETIQESVPKYKKNAKSKMELYCLYDIHKTKTEAFMNTLAILGSPLLPFITLVILSCYQEKKQICKYDPEMI